MAARVINNYAARVLYFMGEGMNQDNLKVWFRWYQWLKKVSGFFGLLILVISGGPRSGRGVNNTFIFWRAYYKEA